MIVSSPLELVMGDLFLALKVAPHFDVNLKIEGLSITGSIKVKAALHMISNMEERGQLREGMHVIESSSGNLGLALAMICAVKGYHFTCVSDPNISQQTSRLIQAYGAELIIVQNRDINGGFLGSRIDLIKSMIAVNKKMVWVNQYENEDNVQAHYESTGPEILSSFPNIDYLFIGAGTTGTLGGVSKYFRRHSPRTRIIAVDSVGSVTFGHPSGKRLIPGLGTSTPPPIHKHSDFDELLMVDEIEAVKMCRQLGTRGMLFGGSTGTVLSGILQYSSSIENNACVVAISPDMGDRYIDMMYSKEWVSRHFPRLNNPAEFPVTETPCALAV